MHIKKLFSIELLLCVISLIISVACSVYSYTNGYMIAYGDAESHLNIAKRVVSSLTPGFSQLGGIWLPLPHLLMVPFVAIDPLWRTGIAGAIVSGFCFIVSSVFLYKLVVLLTKHISAGLISFFVFVTNPNILYMQTTSMTELPLVMFFLLSIYYFMKFLKQTDKFMYLVVAAFFCFCASLSRYDGWFLILTEGFILTIHFINSNQQKQEWFGKIILFSTLAFFGIAIWLAWDFLILGNPLYFSNSPFSAKSQQQGWLARGQLPAYHNFPLSVLYYSVTSFDNIGIVISILALIGFIIFLWKKRTSMMAFTTLLLTTPFVFYTMTLFQGQSVIFTPELTPASYQWQLFNIRYGVMMIPFAAFSVGYLASLRPRILPYLLPLFILFQISLYPLGKAQIVTWEDGVNGLSASKSPDAQYWLALHYDKGYILLDDYARTISIIKSNLPMQKIIYIGNKPYWDQSLQAPEKYATWIVMQKDDTVWKSINDNPKTKARLYTYFNKAYTSPNILIFKRINQNNLSRVTNMSEN